VVEIFPVLGQPAAAVEPRNCPLDDSSFRHDLEPDCSVGRFDDLNVEMRDAEELLTARWRISALDRDESRAGRRFEGDREAPTAG
jgi:hypothetical protein